MPPVFLRYVVTGGVALGVAFGLFVMMDVLVSMGDAALDEKNKLPQIEFARIRKDSNRANKDRKLPERKKPPKAPPAPSMRADMRHAAPGGASLNIEAPKVQHQVDLRGGINLGGPPSDRDEVPIVRSTPIYPQSARERGIEGYVVIGFTISTSGRVKNPKVIRAKPAGTFNRAALQAIKKWKYKPKVVNGKAIETPGQTVKLTFKIDE